MPETAISAPPKYSLFCATWGTFSGESGLPDLTQTQRNAVALSTALSTLNALNGEATLLHDPEGPECMNAAEEFLRTDGGDVILYFASHGLVPTGANQFFRLATGETRDIEDLMRAFVVAEIIDRLGRSRAERKLLIVDACYAGKAAASLLSRPVDLDLPSDMCVVFATDPFSQAVADSDAALTAFTGGLAEVLIRGVPERGPQLSMRSIFSHLRSTSEALEIPPPWMVATGTAAEAIMFPNAAQTADVVRGSAEYVERVAAFEHRTEILYVDDDEELRDEFRKELERAGHRVTLAKDPGGAHAALISGYFDIVVIDLLLVDDIPATEFIQMCSHEATDSLIFLVSRPSKGTEDLWARLDAIFPYPSAVKAFLWKPDYTRSIVQHANRIRRARRKTLSHVEGLDDGVAAVTTRMIGRDTALENQTERLQLETRVCVERLVEKWFPSHEAERVYIENMSLRPVDGGHSASCVFTLVPTIRGIEAESVTPLVLKLGPRRDIDEEVRRYDRYVQVGVPLDVRTDKIGSALVGGIGGVIYSFRGGDDNSVREVAQLAPSEIEECMETIFGTGTVKKWFASRGAGDGIRPLDHFTALGYPADRFRKALKALKESHEKLVASLPDESPARAEGLEAVYERMAGSHQATLVHGDLGLDNLIRISDSRYVIIDYRTVGLGPRLVDFTTLEIASWLLARSPEMSRTRRFLDAREAVPRRLQDDRALQVLPEWLRDSLGLARRCRELALANHPDATDREYGALLWLAAVRTSEFKSRATSTAERNTQRALLPAIAIASQVMVYQRGHT
jgi:CheY-like chemotaxis protein